MSSNQEDRPILRRSGAPRKKPAPLGYTVDQASKDAFDAIAKRSGMTKARFFEELVAHIELTDQGIPPWVPPLDRDGELDIPTD